MILAVSRFRVANGMEQEVREAFRNRPRLVEDAPGFLGMEVFTDQDDASVFYLHTRWTDASSFRTWHASDAHRRSHAGIPKGLKLDAAFTQLTLLNDIAQGGNDREDSHNWADLLSEAVLTSPIVCFLGAGLDGRIQVCNSRMASLLKVSEEEVRGQSLWRFLTDPDAARLRERIASGPEASGERVMLNFVPADHMPYSLQCTLQILSRGVAVVGNDFVQDERELQREMGEINSELLVMARERERQNKEVKAAKLSLEKTLHELNTFYWHLRKIREVLPICMKCGKVESGEARWEDLIAFMHSHFPFLSHGYCPECAAMVLSEYPELLP